MVSFIPREAAGATKCPAFPAPSCFEGRLSFIKTRANCAAGARTRVSTGKISAFASFEPDASLIGKAYEAIEETDRIKIADDLLSVAFGSSRVALGLPQLLGSGNSNWLVTALPFAYRHGGRLLSQFGSTAKARKLSRASSTRMSGETVCGPTRPMGITRRNGCFAFSNARFGPGAGRGWCRAAMRDGLAWLGTTGSQTAEKPGTGGCRGGIHGDC